MTKVVRINPRTSQPRDEAQTLRPFVDSIGRAIQGRKDIDDVPPSKSGGAARDVDEFIGELTGRRSQIRV